MQHQQRAFTLIEMAIVLVIVGLLLGGILKGQELIVQAKIRSLIRELDSISVAILGYQDRYKAFPGDDGKAAARWPGSGDGNANGIIDGGFASLSDSDESRKVWGHLRRAGFLGGDSSSLAQPTNAAGGLIGVQHSVGSTGGSTPASELNGLVVCTSLLPGRIAAAIDLQLDDGLSASGQVKGFEQAGSSLTVGSAATSYQEADNRQYIVCKPV